MLSFGAAQLPTAVLPEDDLTNRGDRFCFVHLSIEALSAFSFPRKLRERLCLVSARDKKFARHSPTPGSVGVRTDLHPVDAGTDHQGETPSGTLEGADSSSNPTAWRRESAMRAWFVPPLVIPIFVVLFLPFSSGRPRARQPILPCTAY